MDTISRKNLNIQNRLQTNIESKDAFLQKQLTAKTICKRAISLKNFNHV